MTGCMLFLNLRPPTKATTKLHDSMGGKKLKIRERKSVRERGKNDNPVCIMTPEDVTLARGCSQLAAKRTESDIKLFQRTHSFTLTLYF